MKKRLQHLHTHKKSLGRGILVALLVVCTCVAEIYTGVSVALASQSKIDEASEALSDVQNEIDDIESNQSEVNSELSEKEQELNSILAALDSLEDDIDDTKVEIEETTKELEEAEAQEEEQYESMKLRIQYMYENNTSDSIWQAILESNGFVDMLNRLEYIVEVNQADRDMLTAYEEIVAEVTAKKQELEEEMDSLLAQQEQYVAQQEEVEELIDALEDKKSEYATALAEAQSLAASYKETIAEQEALIAQRLAEEEAARKAAEEEAARIAAEEAAAAAAAAAASEAAASEAAASEAAASEAAAQAAASEAAASEAAAQSGDDGDSSDTGSSSDSSSSDSSSDSSSSDTSSSSSSGSSSSDSSSTSSSSGVTGQDIANYALQFVGNPYVWGGNSLTNGCDCSGFVHLVLAHFGISSPRYSGNFALYGTAVSRSDIQVGDIVVYSGHVAIYIGNGKIVEAQSTKAGITCTRSVDCSTIIAIRRYT